MKATGYLMAICGAAAVTALLKLFGAHVNATTVALALLLVDYVLTVSVSVAACVAAIPSAAHGTRLAWLADHKVALCLGFIALVAVANLRGVRESGALFAAPTYVFIVSFLFMIGYGIIHYFVYGGTAPAPTPEGLKTAEGLQPLTVLLLLLGAFSNGCAALTGIEGVVVTSVPYHLKR